MKRHDFSTYQPHSTRLAAVIRQHAPSARLLVQQAWAYRVDAPRFTKPTDKLGEPRTQAQMFDGLSAAYAQFAALISARIMPVGAANFASRHQVL